MAAYNSTSITSMRNEDETEKGVVMKSRSALFDITNDSPIVGLATRNLKTPSSKISKTRAIILNSESNQATTPGSGEDLLRGQVKTLLQKVEEEAMISFESRKFMNLLSPLYLLAPTPANTPQLSENGNNGSESLTVSPVVAESFNFSQIDQQEEKEETLEKNVITKVLFTDFLEKFEGFDSSLENKEEEEDDDDESIWSVQVNASTRDEYDDDQDFHVNYEGGVDELETMSKFCLDDDGVKFDGKYKIYEYDSDGDLQVEA